MNCSPCLIHSDKDRLMDSSIFRPSPDLRREQGTGVNQHLSRNTIHVVTFMFLRATKPQEFLKLLHLLCETEGVAITPPLHRAHLSQQLIYLPLSANRDISSSAAMQYLPWGQGTINSKPSCYRGPKQQSKRRKAGLLLYHFGRSET